MPHAPTDLEHACPRCRAPFGNAILRGGWRCPACGLEFREIDGVLSCLESDQVNEWQGFFQDRASALDRDTSAANDYRTALQQRYMMRAFRSACGVLRNHERILDVGCGNGLFWAALSGKSNVVGVDYSLGMCGLARARGMRVYHADANALPFADGQFDLIYSAEMLQCIEDLAPLVGELARVCRIDGRIVLSTLNRKSSLRRAIRQVRRLIPDKAAPARTSAIMRTAAEIADAGRRCALSLRSVCWVHFPVPWRWRTATEYYPLEPLATNTIVEFVKPPPTRSSPP